jgi:phosphatidyl-myo-inositol dimannoside synthase
MATRSELLIITRNLPPLRGGMERLNARMASALALDYRVTVLAPRGSTLDADPSIRLMCCPLGGLAAFLLWAAVVGTWRAVLDRPRWVLAGSGLTAPMVLLASRFSRARAAAYLHGLDIVVQSRLYRALWLPSIRRLDRCVVNSRNTQRLAIDAGVDPSRTVIVHPGVALPTPVAPAVLQAEMQAFRARHALGEGPVVLSVGRLTRRKGLVEFVERAWASLLARAPDARLVVIGDEAPDALNASGAGQRQRLDEAIRRAGLSASIHVLGPVPEAELLAAFAVASSHVFPGVDVPGDVEGFGMVAIEAAAHGVPTVAFDVGGVADAVDDPASGALVPPGDYVALTEALARHLAHPSPMHAAAASFAARFEWSLFGRAMREALAAGT